MKPRRKRIRKLSSTDSDSSTEKDPSSQNQHRKNNQSEAELQLSHISGDNDSDNSSVESMDIIMYPSASALLKIQNSKSCDKKSENKNDNNRKLKDSPQKSLSGKSTKSDFTAKKLTKKNTFNKRVTRLSKELSEIERLSSELKPKNNVQSKVVENADKSTNKTINSSSISIITKGNRFPITLQTCATSKENKTVSNKSHLSQFTSNEKEESSSNKYQESNTAASRNFQDKRPDMSRTKRSTVKTRSENYGSRMNGLLIDLESQSNNKIQSSEERNQIQTKKQCKIKDGNVTKNPKIQISNQNLKPQSTKCDSYSETLPEVGNEEQSASELFHSKDLNNDGQVGCSSNFYHRTIHPTKDIKLNLENSGTDREFRKTKSQSCNALESQNNYPKESDKIQRNTSSINYLNLIKKIVDLDTKWLKEKENNSEPPQNLLEGVGQLRLFFDSYDEYCNKYLLMLGLEIWEKICFTTKANQNKNNNFEFSVDSHKYAYGLMSLDCKAAVHAPEENSLVIVQLKLDGGKVKSTFGFIEKPECKTNEDNEKHHKPPKRQLNFKMFVKSRQMVPEKSQMKGKFLCSLYKEIKQAEALYFMQSSPLLKDILKPSWETFSTSFKQFDNGDFFDNQQNISDIVSKEISVSPSKPKIMLLQGPPGSGKTHAISNIASKLLRRKDDFKKILIVAPNHFALDEIGNQLLKLNDLFVDPINFVRLGKIENIQRKLLDYSLHRKCRMSCKDNYRSSNSVFKNIDKMQQLDNYQQYIEKILSDTSLILAVPEDCWELRKYRVKFFCCLMDEVNQGTELDTLYPFALGISKFLLIADPMQLPADVKSRTAMTYGYQRSIMERFQSYFMRYTLKNPTIVLSHQYRINSSIAKFPFKNFYSDYPLISSSYADKRSTFYPFRPYIVLDDKCKYKTKEKASGVNIIISLCSYIIDKDDTSSIGIIVPSDKEQQAYQTAIKSNPALSKVEVKTVDHFQGQEKTVIILSCYHNFIEVVPFRSDYFRDKRKLNVGLTRAVSCLIICGPVYELQKYSIWSDIVTDSRIRGCYFKFESMGRVQDILNNLNK